MISNKMKSKRYVGLLYIAPWLLGFLIFQLYPFIASFCYSFTDYTLLNQPQFVGLKNYLTLFTTDKQFLSTMKITGFYALLSVALITLSLLQVWQFGSAMVIFLAALKGIPAELYEAASIDGSGKWNQFLHITLPQISSVVFFNLIMQSIQALQNFTSAFVITGGGPMKRTYIIGMKLYDDAFRFYKVGYACAESWILFLVILALTLLVFKSSDAWVYYADEGGSKK